MVIRQRAVLAQDKQERHQAILDAAERLLARSPERVASVAEVADEAGLAKGTVYLYFPSKEELLLAVHERNSANFFGAMQARLQGPVPISIEDMLGLTRVYVLEVPTFLPLATRCLGIMGTEIPTHTAHAYLERMNQRLAAAGEGLERHFPELRPGDGMALLHHSHALILGLWQLSTAKRGPDNEMHCPIPRFDYEQELARALRALWRGTIAESNAPTE